MSLPRRAYHQLAYPAAPPCHILLEPFVETGSVHTRLFLLSSRIGDAFARANLPRPAFIDLTFTVYGADGAAVHRDEVPRHPLDRPLVWESRERLPAALHPGEGTIAIESALVDRHGARVSEAALEQVWGHASAPIADFSIDYYDDARFITTTHSNIAVRMPATPLRRAVAGAVRRAGRSRAFRGLRSASWTRPGAVVAVHDDTFESALVSYAWRERTGRGELWAELRNAAGETRRAPLPPLAPHGSARLGVGDLFADSRRFLDGRPGQLLLDGVSPLLAMNPRFYVRTGFGVDHAYLEYPVSASFTSKETWRWTGKGYVSPCVVIDREDARTAVAVFNHVDIARPKSVGILLYDLKGQLVVEKQPVAALPARGMTTIRIRDLLDEIGYRGEFLGHAEVFYAMNAERYPDLLHHQVLYCQRASVESVQLGVGLWNAPPGWEPRGARDIQGQGAEPIIVAPAYADGSCTTMLGLTNCSHAWAYDVEALVTVRLQVDDRVVAQAGITIPPHGTWLDSIATLFPDVEVRLRPSKGRSLVVIRPENVRTLGAQFFHVQHATGGFSSEHTL